MDIMAAKSGRRTSSSKIIGKAIKFAREKHKGQKDDEGKEYILHPIAVANLVRQVSSDPAVIAAAYLHDTLEDTDTSYRELKKEFGKRIADLVLELTHEGESSSGYYFPRLRSKDAILVKFADRLHNLSRMECWSREKRGRYLKKSKFWKDAPDK